MALKAAIGLSQHDLDISRSVREGSTSPQLQGNDALPFRDFVLRGPLGCRRFATRLLTPDAHESPEVAICKLGKVSVLLSGTRRL